MMNNLLTLDIGNLHGTGSLGLENEAGTQAPVIFNQTITLIVGVLTVVAAIWFVIQMLIGGIGIISAGGDKGKIEENRQKIVNGIIGIIVVVAAVFLVDLAGQLLGIEDILNPALFIQSNE